MNVQALPPHADQLPPGPKDDTNALDDELSEATSHQEWTDFLSSSVLALSLDDSDELDPSLPRVKPQPISTSPTQVSRSPLVIAMSPLASIQTPTSEDSESSWAAWQLSMPENNQLENTHDMNSNNGSVSPLGVPLLHDGDLPHRMRAKSFSTLYSPDPAMSRSSHYHHLAPDTSSFALRRYSGDFEASFTSSTHEVHPPPPRGIRSYSMGGYPSPSLHPAADPRQFRSSRQMPRQPHPPPPLPAKSTAHPFDWNPRAMPSSIREDFMPPPPPPPLPPNSPELHMANYDTFYEVQFKRCRKDVFAGVNGYQLGEYVKVEGDRGEDVGHVIRILPNKEKPATDGSTEDKEVRVKRIMRPASEAELELLRQQHKEEQEVLQVCRTKVRQRMLPMNVIDAEYQFDRHKLTFFFEADRRIDFRELVRDLFAIYKTRIWLQQVVNKNQLVSNNNQQAHQE
ncbi:unnamed protein product [Aphanomyces euteiches]